MTKPWRWILFGAGIVFVSVGCVSSSPTRFYTLEMTSSQRVHPAATVRIESLRTSEMLVRREMLVRKSPTEIEYYEGASWASAINELVSQKLKAELGDEVKGGRTIVAWGALLECGQEERPEGHKAHLRLQLAFRKEGTSRYDAPLFEKTYDVVMPVAKATPDNVAVTLTRCLEEVARQIADDVAVHIATMDKQGKAGNVP